MYVWMIAAALLAVACAILAATCIRQKKTLEHQSAQAADAEALRREIRAVRGEDVRRRREIASLYRTLEEEQAACDALARDLEYAQDLLHDAEQRAEQAEARRIRTEKDVYASKMRADLLEKQIAKLNQEQLNQEKLYQDILKERDAQIARMQDSAPKRRARKKPDVLNDQVSLDDLLGGL